MNNVYSFSLAAVALLFAGLLAIRSEAVNRYKNRYYLCAILVNITILISESLGYSSQEKFNIYVHTITNMVSFSLAPILPYCLIRMNRTGWRLTEKLLLVPGIINVLHALVSPYTQWAFYVTADNVYHRGPLFIVSVLIASAYLLVLSVDTFRAYKDADVSERIFLAGIIGMVLFGIGVQLIYPDITSMWPSCAIALILYYTFILQLNGKYDSLTGVRNRSAFEKKKTILPDSRDYLLVVIDINGLKTTNDESGHAEGDLLIMDAAKVLVNSFSRMGKVYRIGGDEFCIVCENESAATVEEAMARFRKNMSKINKEREIPLNMAYGYKEHIPGSGEDFNQIFKAADAAMYNMKKDFYQQHMEFDRRADRR